MRSKVMVGKTATTNTVERGPPLKYTIFYRSYGEELRFHLMKEIQCDGRMRVNDTRVNNTRVKDTIVNAE